MPRESKIESGTLAWMNKAREDLRAAKVDLEANPPLIDDALFHCQQAVEKSLKAFLCRHDRPFRKTHSIEEIGAACIALAPSLEKLVGDTVHMTEYATAFRYPGDFSPDREEADEALSLAEDAVDEISAMLPDDSPSEG